MWPRTVTWSDLRFGVEIEFVGADAQAMELLPGWRLGPDEWQISEAGGESGGELQSPILTWPQRVEIGEMLNRLQAIGARVNWSCGLHVHVGIEPWGEDMILPLINTALVCQDGLRQLFQTPAERMLFCPPVVPAMRERYQERPERSSLVHKGGRPQAHRCGLNAAAWFDIGTVEVRYPNATLEYGEICQTVEFALRLVAAVGEGRSLPAEPGELAQVLSMPLEGYPPPHKAPLWYRERAWLEESLLPALTPKVQELVPGGEILEIRPTERGLLVAVEPEAQGTTYYRFFPEAGGWGVELDAAGTPLAVRRVKGAEAPLILIQEILHEAYAENLQAGFNFTAATITLAELEQVVREAETYLLLAGAEPVGTISLWPDQTIGRFGVRPTQKRLGYGRHLLAFAEDRGRLKGWPKLVLDTPITHPWLPAFYQRYGFRPVDRVRWEGKRYESVIMEKDLT